LNINKSENVLILKWMMGYTHSNLKKADPIEPLCKKAIYNSMEEAMDMISYIKENRGGKDLKAYKCNVCGFWHLTSKSN